MSRNWVVGNRIDYREITVSLDELIQEQRFGWEVLGPVVFAPGMKPSFKLIVANSIHTNPEIARRYGLRDAVVPGVRLFAYISDMFLQHFGLAWIEGGTLSVKFIAPALSGDVLRTSAVVKELVTDTAGNYLVFKVLVTNQHDQQLVQGEAKVNVP